LPQSPYNYEGSSLVNRNAAGSRFLIEPNNLSQTSIGIRGKIEFSHAWQGWSVVFNAATGINPQSGQLANASATDIQDNGLPRASYSLAIDGARAGQPFNDEYYGGISSGILGTLTFGRQRSLGTDAMLQYDPASGAYAFSYIGYNGTMAGGGDTEDSRWDDAVKYRVTYGPVHFGAMYKFTDGSGGCYAAAAAAGTYWDATTCTPEKPHNNAYGFNGGGAYARFSTDLVYQHYNQAISVLNPLLGPQSPSSPLTSGYQSTTDSIDTTSISGVNLIDTTNTVYGIVTDNNAIMATARVTWEQFKYYAGYEYIVQNNPKNPLGVGATDQGGYLMSGVEDNNLDLTKIVQIWWTGLKYSYSPKTAVTLSFYQQVQNDFRSSPCTSTSYRSSCAGTLNEASLYTDHHFTRRFDGFAGLAYSDVTGGLGIAIPHGPGVPYLHKSNYAPTVGGRFTF
jgi:predicted porin